MLILPAGKSRHSGTPVEEPRAVPEEGLLMAAAPREDEAILAGKEIEKGTRDSRRRSERGKNCHRLGKGEAQKGICLRSSENTPEASGRRVHPKGHSARVSFDAGITRIRRGYLPDAGIAQYTHDPTRHPLNAGIMDV